MVETINILYIHGMGGGGDSRIPGILREYFDGISFRCGGDDPEAGKAAESGTGASGRARIVVTVRTYDFDPEIAQRQIAAWTEELRPKLVIGESLGAINALRVHGMPHLFVSPSLNAPLFLGCLAPLSRIPGVTRLLDRIYRPKPGDRQPLHFTHETLSHYRAHREAAMAELPDTYFAFFGTRDHYRRSGVVSIRTWRKYFGESSYSTYKGTHFMEEEYVHSMLIPKILEIIQLS